MTLPEAKLLSLKLSSVLFKNAAELRRTVTTKAGCKRTHRLLVKGVGNPLGERGPNGEPNIVVLKKLTQVNFMFSREISTVEDAAKNPFLKAVADDPGYISRNLALILMKETSKVPNLPVTLPSVADVGEIRFHDVTDINCFNSFVYRVGQRNNCVNCLAC